MKTSYLVLILFQFACALLFCIVSVTSSYASIKESVFYKGSLTYFFQGSDDFNDGNSGKFDMLLNVDLDKPGWWKGARLTVHGEANFGHSVNNKGGIMMPVNMDSLFPGEDGSDRYDLSSVYFTKRIGKASALIFGKINMFDEMMAEESPECVHVLRRMAEAERWLKEKQPQ